MPIYIGKAITALSIIAISAYIWIASEEFPANVHQVPQFTSGMAMFLSLFLLFDAFCTRDNSKKIEVDISYASNKQFLMFALVLVYVPAMFWIGYFTSSFLLLILGSLIVGVRSFKPIAITVIISLPLMYAFFEFFLHAQLPQGWLI